VHPLDAASPESETGERPEDNETVQNPEPSGPDFGKNILDESMFLG
jgi:hypothetical protein